MTSVSLGDWSERKTSILGSEAVEVFNQSVKTLIGVNYELIAFYEQVVNGKKYCFEVNATVVAPGASTETKWAYVDVSSSGDIGRPVFKDHPPKN